mgnify:CR=1 FL=1
MDAGPRSIIPREGQTGKRSSIYFARKRLRLFPGRHGAKQASVHGGWGQTLVQAVPTETCPRLPGLRRRSLVWFIAWIPPVNGPSKVTQREAESVSLAPRPHLARVRTELAVAATSAAQEPGSAVCGRALRARDPAGDLFGEALPEGVDQPQGPGPDGGREHEPGAEHGVEL